MVSGQAPNPQTQADCQFYTDFAPGDVGADGQAMGTGCVYPAAVKTIADQLTAKGLTWGGYMEDMGNSTTEAQTCRHPALGGRDDTQSAKRRRPVRGAPQPVRLLPLDHRLARLRDATTSRSTGSARPRRRPAPNYVFITPNLCHDGHDTPCVDGQPGGLDQRRRVPAPVGAADPPARAPTATAAC